MPRSRPSVTDAKAMVYRPDNTAHTGTVPIQPDGAMYGPAASDAQMFASLAGISFPLGS